MPAAGGWWQPGPLRHEDPFSRAGSNGRCRFGQETFAEASRNGQDAPMIGIGGHLAAPPLPTTGHTGHVPGGSTGLSWDTDMASGPEPGFGVLLRHDWFGPLAAADRSFTLIRRFQGQ